MPSSRPRTYRSDRRADAARRTRRVVLSAATSVFLARGYAGATMRSIAAEAGVSVATVELLFGTKAAVLKAAIDVAIVGDDEQVGVLDREWIARAEETPDVEAFFALIAEVLTLAQARSAGLVVSVFEAASVDTDLAALSLQLTAQRRATAEWAIRTLAAKTALRIELTPADAADSLWILMDPAVFIRLIRDRGWPAARYQGWFADSARRLLVPDPRP